MPGRHVWNQVEMAQFNLVHHPYTFRPGLFVLGGPRVLDGR